MADTLHALFHLIQQSNEIAFTTIVNGPILGCREDLMRRCMFLTQNNCLMNVNLTPKHSPYSGTKLSKGVFEVYKTFRFSQAYIICFSYKLQCVPVIIYTDELGTEEKVYFSNLSAGLEQGLDCFKLQQSLEIHLLLILSIVRFGFGSLLCLLFDKRLSYMGMCPCSHW